MTGHFQRIAPQSLPACLSYFVLFFLPFPLSAKQQTFLSSRPKEWAEIKAPFKWFFYVVSNTVSKNCPNYHRHSPCTLSLSQLRARTHSNILTLVCLHRPAAYPALYQVTKVGWTGVETAVKGAEGSCAHLLCCKNINSTLADRELSDTVAVMQSLLMADREKAQLLH